MNIRRTYIASALVFLLQAAGAYGQDDAAFRIIREGNLFLGLQASLDLTWHTGSIATASRPCDCEFRDGRGIGFSLGARGILPVSGAIFFRPGIAYERLGGDFESIRSAYPMLGTRHQVEVVDFDDLLSVRMDVLTMELLGGWAFVPEGLFLVGGPAVSYVVNGQYLQTESILTPGVLFLDGSTETVLLDETPPGLHRVIVSLRMGAGAIFDISPEAVLSPEIDFAIPLQDVTSGESWRIGGFQASLSAYVRMPL